MNRSIQVLLVVLLISSQVLAQWNQWTPQQLEAYRQQQYYNWYYQQQRAQQVAQPQPTAAPAATPHPVWGHAQSDDKGNFWHGDDNAKLLLVAKSSWP